LQRMSKAHKELSSAPEFDYILINDDLDKAILKAKELVQEFISK